MGRVALSSRVDGQLWRPGALDPAGTDFAIRFLRAAWRYHQVSAERLADDLAGLPAKIDHVDALEGEGILGGEQPTAADLQIGATLRVLLTVGDLRHLLEGRPAERIARAPGSPTTPGRSRPEPSPRGGSPPLPDQRDRAEYFPRSGLA